MFDHSLVAVERVGPDARYRLLETMRIYGRRRLEDRGDLATWRQRHAEHFTVLAEAATSGIEGPEEARWVRRIDVDLANLRAAHTWALTTGNADLALRLPAGLRPYAYLGLRDEIHDWALRALSLPDAERSAHHPAALVGAGVGWMQRGEIARAVACGEQVLAACPDPPVALRARRLLAEAALYQGRLGATEQHGGKIVEGARAAGRPYDEACGHLYRVHAATYDGRHEVAETALAAGWRLAERLGSPTLQAGFWFLEGEIRLDAEPDTALAAFGRAITTERSVGNRFVEGVSRVAAASLEARHGHPVEALRSFRDVIDHWRTSGDWAHRWTTLRNLLVLFERVGAVRAVRAEPPGPDGSLPRRPDGTA